MKKETKETKKINLSPNLKQMADLSTELANFIDKNIKKMPALWLMGSLAQPLHYLIMEFVKQNKLDNKEPISALAAELASFLSFIYSSFQKEDNESD